MRINYWHLCPRGRAAVYCFSLLCAGYVIPSNSLRATLCALFNTLQMGGGKKKQSPKHYRHSKPKISLTLLSPAFIIGARERAWEKNLKQVFGNIWRRFLETASKTSVGSFYSGLPMHYMHLLLWNLLLQTAQLPGGQSLPKSCFYTRVLLERSNN